MPLGKDPKGHEIQRFKQGLDRWGQVLRDGLLAMGKRSCPIADWGSQS